MKTRFLSSAESDFAEAFHFYVEESPQAADGFSVEVERAVSAIASNPRMYPVQEDEIRVKRLRRYPFSIFYTLLLEEILVLSVSADAKNERHWRDRL